MCVCMQIPVGYTRNCTSAFATVSTLTSGWEPSFPTLAQMDYEKR